MCIRDSFRSISKAGARQNKIPLFQVRVSMGSVAAGAFAEGSAYAETTEASVFYQRTGLGVRSLKVFVIGPAFAHEAETRQGDRAGFNSKLIVFTHSSCLLYTSLWRKRWNGSLEFT